MADRSTARGNVEYYRREGRKDYLVSLLWFLGAIILGRILAFPLVHDAFAHYEGILKLFVWCSGALLAVGIPVAVARFYYHGARVCRNAVRYHVEEDKRYTEERRIRGVKNWQHEESAREKHERIVAEIRSGDFHSVAEGDLAEYARYAWDHFPDWRPMAEKVFTRSVSIRYGHIDEGRGSWQPSGASLADGGWIKIDESMRGNNSAGIIVHETAHAAAPSHGLEGEIFATQWGWRAEQAFGWGSRGTRYDEVRGYVLSIPHYRELYEGDF